MNTVHPVKRMTVRSLVALTVTTALGLIAVQRARAADPAATDDSVASGNTLQEVVVTAEKRSSNLQDTPIAVNAFNAQALKQSGVTDTAELGLITPGLTFGSEFGYGQPHLRGVGTLADGPGVENPVALYVDNVYMGPMAGSIFSLANIKDVEVLKGPQGTLFGRNATGGLIQVTTMDPTHAFGGEVALTYGNYDTWGTDLYMTGGISSAVAADLTVHFQNQGTGYGTNAYTGLDVNKNQDAAVRSKWLFSIGDATTIKVIGDYEHSTSIPALVPAPGTTPLGGPPYTGNPWGLNGYYQPHGMTAGEGLSVQLNQDLGFGTFKSITAYRISSMDQAFDGSLVTDYDYALNIVIWDNHKQFTQEFQLVSPDSSKIKWIGGVFLYDADGQYEPIALQGGLLYPLTYDYTYSDQKSLSAAGYGQATIEVAHATNLTVGARLTGEQRRFSAYNAFGPPAAIIDNGPQQRLDFAKPTYRIALDHRFSPQAMAYVSFNTGFKSGGFNDDLVPTTTYKPETLKAYEAGLKLDLLHRRLRVDGSTFLYDYKNIQAIRYPSGLELIFNGAAARIYGVDLDVQAKITDNLLLVSGVEWLHARYTSFPQADYSTPAPGGGTNFGIFDATGRALAMAPDATVDESLIYTVPTPSGVYTASVNYSFNSGWYCDPDNRLHQPGYGVFNGKFTWDSPSELWQASLWAKNVGSKAYLTALASQGNGDYAGYAPPRTYGLTVSRKF